MLNAITIDVEEWFNVSRFKKYIDPSEWPELESRVIESLARVLTILKDYDVKATFFILGWVAERHPQLVEMIEEHGHDVGTHGYNHQFVYDQSPSEFAADLKKSIEVLGRYTSRPIDTYRAPSFSININSLWAFQILKDHGINYDSSLFPVKHDLYGGIKSPVDFFKVPLNGKGYILECPLATREVGDRSFPIAGGGYLRMFPIKFLMNSIKMINEKGRPAVIYFHPWEIDEFQPRVNAGLLDRFFHYNNIEDTEKKVRALLEMFSFSSLKDVVEQTQVDLIWPEW